MTKLGEYAARLVAMTPRTRWLASMVWGCVWVSLAGCATTRANSEANPTPDPHAMYPLQDGNAWSYDVDTGETSTTLAVTRVEARTGDEVAAAAA